MISRIPFNAVQQNVYQLLSTGQTIPTYDSVPTGPERMPYATGSAASTHSSIEPTTTVPASSASSVRRFLLYRCRA